MEDRTAHRGGQKSSTKEGGGKIREEKATVPDFNLLEVTPVQKKDLPDGLQMRSSYEERQSGVLTSKIGLN